MEASDAQAYIGRWQAVAKLKQQERQAASLAENWRRLNAIKQRASRLDITRKDDDGEMEIFLLWARLKAEYVPN
ncbi:MAG: hypothetical protein H6667_09325 [Ardenticatenaceae bacterium]|nr:hypothetical protein [Ardenticatenaceae bacterium]MCB9446020.1 hypothetical protein [Ardenticatenaceae bacterium]